MQTIFNKNNNNIEFILIVGYQETEWLEVFVIYLQ